MTQVPVTSDLEGYAQFWGWWLTIIAVGGTFAVALIVILLGAILWQLSAAADRLW